MYETTTTKLALPTIAVRQRMPVKNGTINPTTGKPFTDKSKARLGVDPDRSVVWPNPNFDLTTHNTLLAFCRARNVEVADLLAGVCMEWVAANYAQIEAEAAAHTVGEPTAEEAQKMIDAAQRKIERTLAYLEHLKTKGAK